MGSTPDIPTVNSSMDNSLDRAHSLSSLENGPVITAASASSDDAPEGENVSVKSAPIGLTEEVLVPEVHKPPEPMIIVEDVDTNSQQQKPPSVSFSTTSSTTSSASSVDTSPSEPIQCTCPADQSIVSDSPQPQPRPVSVTKPPPKPMSCEMCNNYELQLQDIQYREGVLSLEIGQKAKQIKQLKEELKKEQKFRLELEEKYNEEAKKTENETRSLSQRVDEGQRTIAKLIQMFNDLEKKDTDIVHQLISELERAKKEVGRLAHDNEILLGKTLAKSQKLLQEDIDLPQAQDDMQLYCLKLREDLIQALVSKEHVEEQLNSENLFLREQLRGEQQSKENLEESFAQENELLNSTLESKNLALNDSRIRCSSAEKELDGLKSSFNKLQTSSVQRISELEAQLSDLTAAKTKTDSDVQQLRNKVQTLQVDLDNSETVQRDFVKLSQSLQVQLEKIRQADTEVRWQHMDDVPECNSCKRAFHSKKEKINCKHCGRIFCSECTSKVIYSGPKQRPAEVCNVCHTLLDNQTACWFVNEAPQSPT